MAPPKASVFLLILGACILGASYLGFMYPAINTLAFIGICLIVLIGGSIKFEFAAAASLFELTFGGQGYLFSIPIAHYSLSLRAILFIITICLWVFWRIRIRKLPSLVHNKIKYWLAAFILMAAIGFVVGIFRNGAKLSFFDANAYAALLYFPMFLDVWTSVSGRQRMLKILASGSLLLAIFTIGLLGMYAAFHYDPSLAGATSVNDKILAELNDPGSTSSILTQRTNYLPEKLQLHAGEVTKTKPISYRWLRDTGTAQISYISGRFFRVFFPSHIILAAWFCFYSALGFALAKKYFWRWFVNWSLLLLALVISFSRSLWLGTGIVILVSIFYWLWQMAKKRKILLASITSILFISVIAAVLLFVPQIHERLVSIITPQKEIAATHRIELAKAIWQHGKQYPIFGSGFGTTLIFPTVLPNGAVVQVAFFVYEWAYFDIAVKLGIVGLLLFCMIPLWVLGKGISIFKTKKGIFVLGGIFASLSLVVANITTPVLIHPLGLSMLACCFALITSYATENTDSNSNVE